MNTTLLNLRQIHWHRLEKLGLVSLEYEPDDSADLDNILCCCDENDCEENHRQPELRQAEQEGVWGLVGSYTINGHKYTGDSVWGFIGQATDNSYAYDIKIATMDEFRNAIRNRCRHCMGTGRRRIGQ